MRFVEFYRRSRPVISFEVFPPRAERSRLELEDRLKRLLSLGPSFITVTYGALGGERERTLEIAAAIKALGGETAHHLTCVGNHRGEIDRLLDQISERGIENIVALRGDPPQGQTRFEPVVGGHRHAADLVAQIRATGRFSVAVAGYPEKHVEAPDLATDIAHLRSKVDRGADLVITQLFYDNSAYFSFVRRCRESGIHQPIVPGLLPILNVAQIKRITSVCGSTLPETLLERLEEADGDEKKVFEVGVSHTARQAVELLERGAPGIHFYVLNRYAHIAEIMGRVEPALRRLEKQNGAQPPRSAKPAGTSSKMAG